MLNNKARKYTHFLIGFVAGIIFILLIFSSLIFYIQKTGINVSINIDEIVIPTTNKLSNLYKTEINSAITAVKENIPNIAKGALKSRKTNNNANLNISGFNIILPNTFVQEFESKVLEIVESALYELIDNIQVSNYIEEFSQKQPIIITEFIKKEFEHKEISVKLPGGFNIPININFENLY